MNEIRDEYVKLRDKVHAINYEESDKSTAIEALIADDEIKYKTKTALIAVHNSNKSDISILKHYHIKALMDMVEINIRNTYEYEKLKIEIDVLKEAANKEPWYAARNLFKYISIIGAVFLVLWILNSQDKEATESTVSAFTNLLDHISKGIFKLL